MKSHQLFIPLVAVSILSACTTMRPSMSYVAPGLNAQDAEIIASDSVAYLARTLPPAKTTIIIDPKRSDILTKTMQEKLASRGFGVVELKNVKSIEEVAQGTLLRYISTPIEYGYALRLQYNNIEATRYYPRTTAGNITPVAPFVTRELNK